MSDELLEGITLADAQAAIDELGRADGCVYRESKSERIDDEVRPR
jgi:hypothetical protein